MRRSEYQAALALCLPFALACLAACRAIVPPQPEALDVWKDSAAGVADSALARLCEDYWEAHLRASPIAATYLGDMRNSDQVDMTDWGSMVRRSEELNVLRRRHAQITGSALGEEDRITWELLGEEIAKEIADIALDFRSFTVDPIEGPHIRFLNLAQVQPQRTPRDREKLVARWERFGDGIRQTQRNLARGKLEGRLPTHNAVLKTIEQIEAILDTPPMDSPLVTAVTGGGRWVDLPPKASVAEVAHEELGDARYQKDLRLVNLHLQEGSRLSVGTRVLIPAADDPLRPEERGKLLFGALNAVEKSFYPALASYRDFLRDELAAVSRGDEEVGLVNVPGGERMYRERIHAETSLPLEECDPRAIHEFGLAEVARIRAEISELGARVLGTSDVSTIQRRLRHDPAMHFSTRDEVQAKAEEALAKAERRMPEFFDIQPKAPCEVVRIPPHEERDSTIAYYRQPAADGSLPGRYFINTFAPETRPRYEAEVLAYHEAVPGHHLQIAIAQELTKLPRFRRHMGSTAFVEGWALYTERLSDEMGLYSDDLDRLGMLSFDAWRASRLVVDTGLHALGWSRDQAIDYMYENTLLARNNVENEVDRYIAWPAQALAYKIGQREILALRDEARASLGASFSYPEFHDRLLENGAVSLSVLRSIVKRWLGLPLPEAEDLS